jgi:hypothetical protein
MAREEHEMGRSEGRGLSRRALPLLLAIPIFVIPLGAYFVASEGSSGSSLPVAGGAVAGGAFHPIAGEFVADDTELEQCGADEPCLEQGFGNLAFRDGPKPALALFEQRLETDPAVERDCHRIAHFIGSAALERFDGNVAKTFSQGSPACVSGYYHGILERAFLGISTKSELARVARELCVADTIRRRGFLDYQCRHGLGHGLMIQTGYDLPLALSICASLGTGWDHKACAGGAFMENINTRFGFRSPWLDDEDPLYPCAEVSVQDRRSCYLRASWRILTLEGGSFERTATACAALVQWARTCFQGFGRDVAERARYGAAEIRALCRIAGTGEADCLLGAARTVANASGRDGIAPAAELCTESPRAARAACFSGIGIVLGTLHPTDASRRAACARVTRAFAAACARAARAEIAWSGARSWG